MKSTNSIVYAEPGDRLDHFVYGVGLIHIVTQTDTSITIELEWEDEPAPTKLRFSKRKLPDKVVLIKNKFDPTEDECLKMTSILVNAG
jgi:hypothetical protein